MSAQTDENDPDVQRNAFDVYADVFGFPDGVLDTFLESRFEPSDPFEANHQRFWSWFEGAIPTCPTCGVDVSGTEMVGEDPVQVRLEPCGDVHEVDEFGEGVDPEQLG